MVLETKEILFERLVTEEHGDEKVHHRDAETRRNQEIQKQNPNPRAQRWQRTQRKSKAKRKKPG